MVPYSTKGMGCRACAAQGFGCPAAAPGQNWGGISRAEDAVRLCLPLLGLQWRISAWEHKTSSCKSVIEIRFRMGEYLRVEGGVCSVCGPCPSGEGLTSSEFVQSWKVLYAHNQPQESLSFPFLLLHFDIQVEKHRFIWNAFCTPQITARLCEKSAMSRFSKLPFAWTLLVASTCFRNQSLIHFPLRLVKSWTI